MGLLLRAVDVAGPPRWRWLLDRRGHGRAAGRSPSQPPGRVGRGGAVRRPFGYVRSYAAPDRQVEDGTKIVADAGAWAGSALLGEAVGKAIAAAASAGPVSVQVVALPPTDKVLLWPLELAHVAGKPLAARGDVTFVYDITGTGSGPAARTRSRRRTARLRAGRTGRGGRGQGGPLRVLAVFSQPTKTTVLALRRERYALSRLISRDRRQGARRRRTPGRPVRRDAGRPRRDRRQKETAGTCCTCQATATGGAFLLEKADGSHGHRAHRRPGEAAAPCAAAAAGWRSSPPASPPPTRPPRPTACSA